jgi:phage N-6-adenine-methyltransferase
MAGSAPRGLSRVEAANFASLEAVIERGLEGFVEVGNALMAIRDGRLYRESHGTFEDYCRERWSFTRQRASQLVQAASVSNMLDSPPANARQATELAPLLHEPEALRESWAEVRELHPEPTAADVREVVRSKMDVHYSSTTDDWSTPQDLFDLLDAEFHFTLDVCATEESTKVPRHFFTETEDGLAQPWEADEVCWMNPPYGDEIKHWVKKAYHAALEGATVVCLVPARVDTGWWWSYCRFGEVRFLRGRLKFGGGETGAPFPSAVVIFGREPTVVWWER